MTAEEFKKLYLPYHQKLYRLAFRILENSDDAEDLVQEVYIKLWNKRDELTHVENKEAYSVTLLKNLCIDYIRSKSKRMKQASENIEVAEKEVLFEQISAKSDLELIKQLMTLLPEQQQRVLNLRHACGYTNEEVEKITGLTSVNVRVALSRGRSKLRELFKQYSYEYR